MKTSKKTAKDAVEKFTQGMQQVIDTFQRSAAHVQALELLAMCLFATHPNPESVQQMFGVCSKRACVASERQTGAEAPAFHEAFCGHLERIADAMKAPDAAPGVH